ncbi:PREDICTED: protein KRI1 homolog [Ceratosolen solmsi marchali]|uniref:Protein KRI1 homolog n=1 Tax=Ceratosolen solmsi marchali TaxID=326594 RepID=A0AAJ6YFA3_9HYME|nr:PREDICTED: protein KRI1 homolog [Ceratosolen solmsi marchali]
MSKLFKIENFDSDAQININTNYANNYSNWRQKEELHKLKAWYGEDIEFSVKSSEEFNESSEDDEGNEIPEQVEKNFYKTLAYLKNKDPKIYDKNVQFFTEQNNILSNELRVKEKKEKSIFLRDYERKMIIERGGNFSDSEHEIENLYNESCDVTYVKEQEKIKETFKKVLQVDNEIEDVLLKPKIKTKEESQNEKRDYKEWLEGQEKKINEEEKKVLKPLRDFWTNPNLDENEKFLRDYVLHKRFLDKGSKDFDLSCENINHNLDEDLSEDEHCITEQEEFEYKYNFRFEEPDQEFIKRYPRTLENSLRKKNTRRAEKRVELKIRKRQKNVKNQEELKQLKALKRKEIEAKLKKLKEITGNNDLQFNKLDLEEDFDPDEYDMKMSQIFNDEYYTEQTDTKKPEFPDLDRELNIDFNCNLTTTEIIQDQIPYNKAPHCEDAKFNMDADYDDNEKIQTKLVLCNKKKRKRRGKFFEMISKEKPKFDPTQYSSYKQYYDQYYALDYEDIIGDLPCRFKYRQVIPNDYGLTIEEILMADDKELNKWCPLRKAFEYKPEYKELNDVKIYKQKSNNEVLKRKILTSLYK